MSDIEELTIRMREFSEARNWIQFHDPKSLILALVGEVGELAELFQWLPADQAQSLASDPKLEQRAGEEISDVFLYLLRLADVLNIDLADAASRKMETSEQRFSAAEYQGNAPKKQ